MSQANREMAQKLDTEDELLSFRDKFHMPTENGKQCLYFCGHSLGVMPKESRTYINLELDRWAQLGVEGHFTGKTQWLDYADPVGELNAALIGAKKSEVFLAATLSANIHHLFASFYRPTKEKFKILIEDHAFPSDIYAVKSQIRYHGFNPDETLLYLKNGESKQDTDKEIEQIFAEHGDQIALAWIGQPNYLSGEAFNTELIAKLAHKHNAYVGLDLAHGVGNLELNLHSEEIDFACWCTYKYLNSGPGSIGGIYIHEKHHEAQIPRLEGWFGNAEKTRFQMRPDFEPYKDARAWQLSNPPIFQLAALRASLEIFHEAGIQKIHAKRVKLTGFLEQLLKSECSDYIDIVTPSAPEKRGTMLCLRLKGADPKKFADKIRKAGVICDFREPDILRMAPVALYTRFIDICHLVEILQNSRS